MISGEWKLWQDNDHIVILEILDHVAFAYLLDESHRIVSHVWLDNLKGEEPISDRAPPKMSIANMVELREEFPRTVSAISIEYHKAANLWQLRWGSRSIVELQLDETVGRSSLVSIGNDLARPM
jgi:hypothetical protein